MDTQETKITEKEDLTSDDEISVLAVMQEAWESSHDWNVVFEKVKQECDIKTVFSMIDFCAICGYLRILQWLRSPDLPGGPYPWDHMVFYNAANYGHVHVLQWLRNPVSASGRPLPGGPCPWTEWACHNAAFYGHIEVLEYLYEVEAPCRLPNHVHESCKEFLEMYGESWQSRRFDVPLPWQCMKPAKA